MLRCLIALGGALLLACGSPALPPPEPPKPPPPPSAAPPAPTALAPPQPTLRLPKNFVPTSYAARLAIDPEKTTFDGEIAITGAVAEPSALIWLHGRHLRVASASATREGAAPVAIAVTPTGEDLLALRPATPLAAGGWTLHLAYAGDFDELATAGAFRQAVAGEHYVYSQLEAIYARRVFPCVDEPDAKVPWQLTLDVPASLVALSNTPEVTREPQPGGRVRVAFAPTQPLPPYLVAFGVGPFEVLDAGKTKAGVPVRVITLHHRAADAAYAVQTTAGILDVLADYFGIPYAYGKLDVMTIPLTVGFGAMENAGLVTFTESIMLFDQKHPSAERQHTWLVVAAHELAHQWFGDYVTTAWWDDIWLNEGFANWMERKAAVALRPDWHDELSELDTRDHALGDDALTSARQVRQPIDTVDDIETAFDGITYDKGASVLNMFESYLGRDVFQRGVRAYLTARAHGNATSKDFIGAMNTAAGKDLTAAWSSFLDQPGAPQITAAIACDGAPRVQLAQRRYVPPGAPAPAGVAQWTVPVCVAYDRGGARGEACTLLATPSAELALPGATCPRWVMPNVGGRGYYHLAPTAAQVAALRDEAWDKLTWQERRALFADVSDGARTGRLPLPLALSFVPKLLAGGDRFTVGMAVGFAAGFNDGVPDDLRAKYEGWMRATFAAGAAKVGLLPHDGENIDVEATRGELIAAVVGTGRDPVLTAEAVRQAAQWREVPQAMRGTILAIAVDGSGEVFDRTLREVIDEKDRSNREEMLGALAAVRDPKRHLAALDLVLDPRVDIRESMWMLFGGRDRASHDAARAYFRAHEAAILARIPRDDTTGSSSALAGVFTSACDAATRDENVAYVHRVFDSFPGAKRSLAEGTEELDQCIARRALIAPAVRSWLAGLKLPKPGTPPAPPAAAPAKARKHR